MGLGLLETAYEACLSFDLAQRGLRVATQKVLPVVYKGVNVDCGYRLDLLVENLVVVELKAVEKVAPIHKAQILSYSKLTDCPVGLLINFHVPVLRDGIHRFRF